MSNGTALKPDIRFVISGDPTTITYQSLRQQMGKQWAGPPIDEAINICVMFFVPFDDQENFEAAKKEGFTTNDHRASVFRIMDVFFDLNAEKGCKSDEEEACGHLRVIPVKIMDNNNGPKFIVEVFKRNDE